MINERDRHISRRIWARPLPFCNAPPLRPSCGSAREETMTSAMAAFGIAVGGTSLICYLLMTRLQNRRANRGSSGHSCGPDGGNYTGGGCWSISTWFAGDASASDSSANPCDAGGGDSGGSDGGGGGYGGGGG